VWQEGSFERGEEAGLAWLRVVSSGKGSPSFVRNLRPYDPPIDCTGKFIKAWIKLDQIASLDSMEFRLSSDGFASSYFSFEFPVYADENANVLQDGVWTPITLGFGGAQRTGSPDRSSIDSIGWYLADRGSGAPGTWPIHSASRTPRWCAPWSASTSSRHAWPAAAP
jgi:hypothetical protein